MVAPALAGVLIGVAWFGVGGVFVTSGIASAVAAVFVAKLPRVPPRTDFSRSPLGEIIDALGYVRVNHEVRLIALVTVGVVMVGFPYLTFLPTLADDRFDVGAVGYGVMSGVAGLGAVVAGLVTAARSSGARPWVAIGWSGIGFGVGLIALGVANSYPLALLALASLGASGLVFQTTTQALLLHVSDLEYHGRLQSLVILGFSGFGLMALPLGILADNVTLRVTLAAMGAAIVLIIAVVVAARHRHLARTAAIEIG